MFSNEGWTIGSTCVVCDHATIRANEKKINANCAHWVEDNFNRSSSRWKSPIVGATSERLDHHHIYHT